jgi:L-ascorbate metabolism protein UlaG (beta-lactamase superfamily)
MKSILDGGSISTRVARAGRFALVLCGIVGMHMTVTAQDAQFTRILRLTNKEVALQFNAPAGTAYRIDTATNFPASTNSPFWSSLLTLQSAGVNPHTDSAAPFLISRFYRAEQLSGTNVLTGDHLATTNGDVVIHPVNHASFVMSWNGKMIYNDAVGASRYTGFPRADLILVSHDHGDHYDTNVIKAVRATDGIIVLPPGVYNHPRFTSFRSNAVPLAYGQSTNVMGVQIEAVPAYNGNHPFGTNNAYVITLGGRRIFTSGDCGNAMEIRAVTNIDVAFLCMNLPFTMNAASATNVIRAMRPRVVYPYHYSESGGAVLTNAATFKQWLGTDLGIEVRLRKWY